MSHLLHSDTSYHTLAGIATENGENHHFRLSFLFSPTSLLFGNTVQIAISQSGTFGYSFLFSAAQILPVVRSSVLNFFSPLGAGSGAGGAGATPRQVRTAYSWTRCLPHLVDASYISRALPLCLLSPQSQKPALRGPGKVGFRPNGAFCDALTRRSNGAGLSTVKVGAVRHLPQRAARGPTPHFRASDGYGCHPAHRRVAKGLAARNAGLCT